MDEINFGPEDVGKWAFDIVNRDWKKITKFTDYYGNDYPIESRGYVYTSDGKISKHDVFPTLIPSDHPAVIAGKLEIPIPPPPRKRVVLPAGLYHKMRSGRVLPAGPMAYVDDILEEFEITEPITLVEGEE